MASTTPDEACLEIARSFDKFLHHIKTYQEVLEDIDSYINSASRNAYSVGYYEGKEGKPEEIWGTGDWQRHL